MLIELKTKLKSLKYGTTDKPGGNALEDTPPNQGSEATNEAEKAIGIYGIDVDKIGTFGQQPYIRKEIPGADGSFVDDVDEPIIYSGPGILGTGGPDIFIRGGTLSATRAAKDVSRLTQMFLNPGDGARGIQYTVKENLLSKTSVETEASKGFLNQGTYTPLSTIVQGAANAFGGHVNHLGLLPFDNVPGTVPKYEEAVRLNNDPEGEEGLKRINRLIKLTNKLYFDKDSKVTDANFKSPDFKKRNGDILFDYPGGPGSGLLGLGRTKIKLAKTTLGQQWDRTLWNFTGDKTKIGRPQNRTLLFLDGGRGFDKIFKDQNKFQVKKSVSLYYNEIFPISSSNIPNPELETNLPNAKQEALSGSSLYQLDINQINQIDPISQQNIGNGGSKLNPSDFRKDLESFKESIDTGTSTVLSLSPAYNDFNKNIHGRVNLGDPGNPQDKNVWNYSADNLEALDKITASPITTKEGGKENNDLAQFRIGVIGNPNRTVTRDDGSRETSFDGTYYMHFRAFIDNFQDSYNSSWNPVNYVGRGDVLYNYSNFTRNINMGFTVVAQSKAELIPMYNKLNYLASTLAPDYSNSGYMMGNIIQLTVGNYIRRQYGFITNLTYDVPQESPWEIAIDSKGDGSPNREDKGETAELPHVIKAQITFTPIHNFLPQKAKNPNDPTQNFIKQGNY